MLLITRRNDFEADLIGISLLRNGVDYIRLNIDDIPDTIRATYAISKENEDKLIFDLGGYILDPTKISVCLIRYFEVSSLDFGPDNFVYLYTTQQWENILSSLLNELKCNWINNPTAISHAEDRIKQLSVARDLGFDIPASVITNDPNVASNFYNICKGNMIIKVLHHHRIDVQNTAFSIFSQVISASHLKELKALVNAPCMLQERINKEYELRVTVVGDSIFAVRLDPPDNLMFDLHSYTLSEISKKAVTIPVVLQERCKEMLKKLNLDYAALDFAVDRNGRTFFLEANASGDWHWIERDTGLPITDSVVNLILKGRKEQSKP